jgi:hypothetical protein
MLHGAIFLATCNAILLLSSRDVKLPNTSLHYTPLMFSQHIENLIFTVTSLKSRIALQVLTPLRVHIHQKKKIALEIAAKIASVNGPKVSQ